MSGERLSAEIEAMHEHADVLASQRNAALTHGRSPGADENHTSDGRCKYPATCAAEVQVSVEWGVLDADGSCDTYDDETAARRDHARWPGCSLVRLTTFREVVLPPEQADQS